MGETAVVDKPTEQPTMTAADEDADMMAGFNGEVSRTSEPTEPPPAEEDVVEAPEQAKVEEPVKPEPKYRQITEEEYTQLTERIGNLDSFGRKVDTAFGKIGGLERTLREIQSATPAGQTVQISGDDMAELKADFPELTDNMIKGLNRALSKIKGTGTAAPAIDPDAFRNETKAELAEARQVMLHDVMDSLDETWVETVRSPEFADWLSKKPVEEQDKIKTSDKPAFVLKTLKTFRSDLEAAKAKAQPRPKEEPPADPNEARRRRLRAGAQPKATGDGTPVADDEDALMMQGWKNATGG